MRGFMAPHLIAVVHWTGAVWPLQALLVVVHLRAADIVSIVGVRVRKVVLLSTTNAGMWRLPTHLASHMWTIGAATVLLLAVVGGRFEDLRGIVAG